MATVPRAFASALARTGRYESCTIQGYVFRTADLSKRTDDRTYVGGLDTPEGRAIEKTHDALLRQIAVDLESQTGFEADMLVHAWKEQRCFKARVHFREGAGIPFGTYLFLEGESLFIDWRLGYLGHMGFSDWVVREELPPPARLPRSRWMHGMRALEDDGERRLRFRAAPASGGRQL
jgi:hypothetical protein